MTSILPADSDAHFALPPEDRSARATIVLGLVLSLLLHALFAILWLGWKPSDLGTSENELVAIEMVAEPPPPPPAQPAPPPPPPPAPPPPPPPPPAPPPAPPPPPPPPAAAAPPPPPAPPPIQRETARSAARSSVPNPVPARPPAGEAAAPSANTSGPGPASIISPDGLLAPLRLPRAEPRATVGVSRDRVQAPPSGPAGEVLAQSEVDHLLAQIMAIWIIDFRADRFRDLSIFGAFELNPDGTLASPFGAYDPWRPELMIADYQAMLARPDLRDQRTIMESFLGAMRQAQPFKRQPDAPPMTEPKILRFAFRLGDLAPP